MIQIIKEEPYRSKPRVNMADDMIRVTLDMKRTEWRELKKKLIERESR